MKCIILQRGVRLAHKIDNLADIPLEKVYLVCRYLHYDCDGKFFSLQYAFYIPDSHTYTVDLPDKEDWEEFQSHLDSKFKEAGINPPFLKGTIQDFGSDEEC